MVTATVLMLVAAVALQVVALRRMGRRRSIGDEVGYLSDAARPDLAALPIWLRPPLLAWLGALCRRGGRPSEDWMRASMSVAGVATVVLAAAAGWILVGPAGALLSGVLLLAQPERIILGCHVWPDNLLALTVAALNLLLVLSGPSQDALLWGIGVVCAIGSLVRIDFLLAAPLAVFGFWMTTGSLGPPEVLALVTPSAVAVALVSAHNHRRYGVPWPDTTWSFNLVMAASDRLRCPGLPLELDPQIAEAASRWSRVALSEQPREGLAALGRLLLSPGKSVAEVARRLLILAGPDTFVRQVLLPEERAYPELSSRCRRRLEVALTLAFPLLLTTALFTCWIGRVTVGAWVWPSVGLMAASALFHARTRFRVVVLPTLSLLASAGILGTADVLQAEPARAFLMLGAVPFLWGLLRIQCSMERLPTPTDGQQTVELVRLSN